MNYDEAYDILIRRGYEDQIDWRESLEYLQQIVAETTPRHTVQARAILNTKWKTAYYAAEKDKRRTRLSMYELLNYEWYVAASLTAHVLLSRLIKDVAAGIGNIMIIGMMSNKQQQSSSTRFANEMIAVSRCCNVVSINDSKL